ncbi:30S ribosomal protein S15 [Candidatus Nasuia deltocephalinicola]|uniref:30S ribosomal protein S15 n=1 Tax=Candidatus Nasuia deltocephalincola TaxID=1160784 RepID=UPI00216AE84A|nr:30S ribosomal protein S15 [Candidatus Nasuia deltocephalinicola]
MILNTFKKNIIKKYSHNLYDTGSIELQIILLTFKINNLIIHLNKYSKDKNNKRNLSIFISKRKKFLIYLKRKKKYIYNNLIKDLNLIDVVKG